MIAKSQLRFIGIGAPKAGTTSLACLLHDHPKVCLPKTMNQKELNYFTHRYANYEKGMDWYLGQFPFTPADQICGEISPSYFSDPDSAAMIAAQLPTIKLLAILRHPVDRAYSSFLHDQRAGRVAPTQRFEECYLANLKYLQDSRYAIHLDRYLKYFPKKNLHIIFLENLFSDLAGTLGILSAFLEIDSNQFQNAALREENKRWVPRSQELHRLLLSTAQRLRNTTALGWSLHLARKIGVVKFIKRYNASKIMPLSTEFKEQLLVQFYEDDTRLAQICGQEIPWRQK